MATTQDARKYFLKKNIFVKVSKTNNTFSISSKNSFNHVKILSFNQSILSIKIKTH